jgi:DNA polymerase-3 subunit alpha
VAQIGTFGTMAARAAVRDVGRVLNIPLARVDQIAKMIPQTLGITLDEALRASPDLRAEYDADTQIRELVDIARKLEGTNRNAGTHAAGVVISDGPLTDHVPLQRVVGKADESGSKRDQAAVTTQWVMGDLETVGLLKMDFLGLRTLSLLDNAVRLIEKTRGIKVDLEQLPLDDPATFALLQRGDAKGVFQLESDGIRDLLKRMRPDGINDLIACNALYRPGPLGGGMVEAYINRKHGREKPIYPHPVMEEILAETYGVMVYQEQVMRILNRLGGIELSSAYACIKAISKKKHEVIAQRRAEFLAGAQERGVSSTTAGEIFGLITHFGGYGFNKSHSAAYALIGYQTAYLKAHYTPEFMAALLSSEVEDGNKRDIMVQHIEDARRLGVKVLPPNVNTDFADFTVTEGNILFGLVAVKGLGRGAALEIVRARDSQGPFKDILDFCERIDHRIVSRAAIEKLIKAGGFDCLGARRSQFMLVLPAALQGADQLQQDLRHGQRNLFEAGDNGAEAPKSSETLPDVPEWHDSEKLKYEKEALDFYVTSHPLTEFEEVLRRFSTHQARQLAELEINQEVLIGGMITDLRLQNTKKARNGNTRYARFRMEDFSGSVPCVMWPDDYVRFKDEIKDDQICFVRGVIERTREEPGLIVTRLLSIEQAQRDQTRGMVLVFHIGAHSEETIDTVARVLRRAPGPCPVYLNVRDPAGRWAQLKAGNEFCVNPNSIPLDELETILGPGHVRFSGPTNGAARNGR